MRKDEESKSVAVEPENCPTCRKQPELCLCAIVKPIQTDLHVLILQHPQEPDKSLGSARLAHTALKNSTLKIGLSWPNLAKALGRPAAQNINWGVLYLGGKDSKSDARPAKGERLRITTKNGTQYDADDAGLEGIVILDGTWAQAKTLWWRNAWLLKLKRVVVAPTHHSLYGTLRKEPRPDCLSTIEAIADTLEVLGEKSEAPKQLRGYFTELLKRFRALTPPKPSRPQE